LALIERLVDSARRPVLEQEVDAQAAEDHAASSSAARREGASERKRRPISIRRSIPAPEPPDLDRHVESFDLDDVWAWLNPQMLYGKHLGLRGNVERLAEEDDEKYALVHAVVETLKAEARSGGMKARAVWQFFRAESEDERLRLRDRKGALVATWTLPRQGGEEGLCLTDYVVERDHVALLVTSAGEGVRSRVENWKAQGEYLKSHAWAALALETAEAAAELLHRRLREAWGFADPEEFTRRDVLQARYRGKRYSFGYPDCPDLAGQRGLFEALRPGEIGVDLTEGDMMDPEASVSALVFHHPDARYFGV